MKIELNLDATALGSATCERALFLTIAGSIDYDKGIVEGGYKTLMPASAIYGVAFHKFIDVAYKTKGNFALAKAAGLASFNRPKQPPSNKQLWIGDERHF